MHISKSSTRLGKIQRPHMTDSGLLHLAPPKAAALNFPPCGHLSGGVKNRRFVLSAYTGFGDEFPHALIKAMTGKQSPVLECCGLPPKLVRGLERVSSAIICKESSRVAHKVSAFQ